MPIDWQARLNVSESSGESDAANAAAYRRCFSASFRLDSVTLPLRAPTPQALSNSTADAAIMIGSRSLISFAHRIVYNPHSLRTLSPDSCPVNCWDIRLSLASYLITASPKY